MLLSGLILILFWCQLIGPLMIDLVFASKEVHEVHNFFQHANFIVNIVNPAPECNDELLANLTILIAREIELVELDTRRGSN